MIQIIAGTFGYFDGRNVIPISKEDGPQNLAPELEARLVKEGVAEYVDGFNEPDPAGTPTPKGSGTPTNQPTSEPDDGGNKAPDYNEDMKLDRLKEIAKVYGVDASAIRKKIDVIAAIDEVIKKNEDKGTTDDGDLPPNLGAIDPI
jgi:hypothetical protein